MTGSAPFDDFSEFVAVPRLDGLRLSPDGTRLVTAVQRLDSAGAAYVRSLWEIDPTGAEPARRMTRSISGESSPTFRADGSLLFISKRPDPDGGSESEKQPGQLWSLPTSGEAAMIASSPAGCSGPVAARDTAEFVITSDRMHGAVNAEDDERRRTERRERKIGAMLHDGFPIRYWDHELGPDSPRLLVGENLRDIAPDAGGSLTNASYDITPDGQTVVTDWQVRLRHGQRHSNLVAIDVGTGERRTVAAEPDADHRGPVISPDGRMVAAFRETDGDFDTPLTLRLMVHSLDGEPARSIQLDDDVFAGEIVWGPDSATLYVAGDRHGRGAVIAIELATGRQSRLVSDAVYTQLCPSPDGQFLYALRSSMDRPNTPVRLETGRRDQQAVLLPAPVPDLALPGTVTDVSAVAADGATVRGWLFQPTGAQTATPLQLWIHGGPFASYNSWSWRWCPWLAVARGWSVLLPDPALSTGYGSSWFSRAWPHRAAAVWSDVEALLDSVSARDDIDDGQTACLGASFGGYMTNWLAGHTDRFSAIVTHSGLWAADQQHTTTDAANWKTGLFGTPTEHPEWYAENSPHHFVDNITTPMLITHGNKDYRVPYSETLRLWWDLVSRFDGDPADLPHRFLQLPSENHWVLSPGQSVIWNETVSAFLDWHVRGQKWVRPELA